MDTATHIDALQRDGDLLAAAAERVGLDAPVPPCPGWHVRDVVKHTSHVHRWATTQVAEARAEAGGGGSEEEWLRSGPADDTLLEWFREGHRALVGTLRDADPDLSCWTFLEAPSPLAFWARRQAHETAIHRSDAESAGAQRTPFPPAFAADGIDELVMGFAPTPRARVPSETRRVLQVSPTDVGDAWVVGMGPDGIDAERGRADHDCLLEGDVSDLYLLLWNRIDASAPSIRATGSLELLELWEQSLKITWR
ncbi:MAG TPA: maleylpyruvate isomerase family mycothiol-dependent enzyme [Acidimicrobiales bacterium]|nr:maleylpyruvate isomerase family mycothiol-dependent enzyme [Acidimicrobiales bacterium]